MPRSTAAVALVGLTEIYSFSGDSTEAARTGRLAVSISQQQASRLITAHVALGVAQRLLRTSSGGFARGLIASVEAVNVGDMSLQARLSCITAEAALYECSFHEARRLAEAEATFEDPSEISLRKGVVFAAAAFQLGWHRRAQETIDTVIPAAERFGSAPVLLDCYKLACKVMPSPKYTEKVREVASLLTA